MYIYMYIRIYVYIYTCIHICLYALVFICIYAYIHIYIIIYVYTCTLNIHSYAPIKKAVYKSLRITMITANTPTSNAL